MGREKGCEEVEGWVPVTQGQQKTWKKASSVDPQNQGIFLCFASVLCFNLHCTINMPVPHLACAIP